MRRALALAAEAALVGEVPIGAVIVCEGQEVAAERNTRERDFDPCGHAELIAIRAAAQLRRDWRLSGCTLYVTLEPCAMCAGAIVLARLPRVVYAAPDPKGGFCGTLGDLSHHPGLNHHFEVVPGVLKQESAAMLRDFFRRLRTQDR